MQIMQKINLSEDVIICGHRNPDTDSVCSAYALQHYKETIAAPGQHVAVRCGHLNPQTQFIFSHMGITPPPHLPDMYYRARDIMTPTILSSPHVAISKAAQVMREGSLRLIPVQNEEGIYQGVYTLDEMTNFLVERAQSAYTNYEIVVDNLVELLGAQIIMRGKEETVHTGFLVGSMDRDRIEEYFNALDLSQFFLVIGRRSSIIGNAMQRNIAGVIITGDSLESKEIRELCKGYQGWVLRTSLHSENVIRASVMASSVRGHLVPDVETIAPEGLMEEAKQILERQPGLPVVDKEGKLYGMVSRLDILSMKKPRLILTDHNEPSQSILGSEHAEIMEIIDHHRLSPRPTSKPINFFTAPVGSTCTLVAELFFQLDDTLALSQSAPKVQKASKAKAKIKTKIPMDAAKILLSGIISDTVMLRSPTTTERDRAAVAKLAKISALDPMELGNTIYTKGSMLKGMPVEKIIKNDFKEFSHNQVKFGVGQIEVVNLREIGGMEEDLIAELERLTLAQGGSYHWTVLLVTNIHTCDSILLSSSYEPGQINLGYKRIDKHSFDLPSVMSRKKQLLPAMLEALSKDD